MISGQYSVNDLLTWREKIRFIDSMSELIDLQRETKRSYVYQYIGTSSVAADVSLFALRRHLTSPFPGGGA